MNVRKTNYLLLFLFFCNITYSHEFYGTHFMGSYKKCESGVLNRIDNVVRIFREAVEASGATIVGHQTYVFQNQKETGFSLLYILAESHASIHTYPEYNSCFVDLFTCGDHCNYKPFDTILCKYLKPVLIQKRLIYRQ